MFTRIEFGTGSVEGGWSTALTRRLETRLAHLFGRIDRMQSNTADERELKSKFVSQVMLLTSEADDADNLLAD